MNICSAVSDNSINKYLLNEFSKIFISFFFAWIEVRSTYHRLMRPFHFFHRFRIKKIKKKTKKWEKKEKRKQIHIYLNIQIYMYMWGNVQLYTAYANARDLSKRINLYSYVGYCSMSLHMNVRIRIKIRTTFI